MEVNSREVQFRLVVVYLALAEELLVKVPKGEDVAIEGCHDGLRIRVYSRPIREINLEAEDIALE